MSKDQWKSIYFIGAIISVLVIAGTVSDIIAGTYLGGDLSSTPPTTVERFAQLNNNWVLGLYNLDVLNFILTILMIPVYFALTAAHRGDKVTYPFLAAVIYIIGAAVFISNNSGLPMLELSSKYASAATEAQKTLLAGAGEALISRGAHGSPGAFAGFFLLTVGSIVMSIGMLKGNVFKKSTAYLGILGSSLLLVYVVLVTFVPEVKNVAVMVAAPGGILALVWMIMYTVRLFQLGRPEYNPKGDR